MSERNPIFAELCEAAGYHAAQIAGAGGMAPNTWLIRPLGKVEVTLAPSQERIDALELEVRQLTEQIAGLRCSLTEIVGMPTSHATVPVRDYAMQDIAKAALAASKEAAEPAQPALSAAPAEPTAEIENLRKALQFYADGDHFGRSDDTAWDTVSGEPQNWWCDEAGTATVEDGSLARMALAGHPFPEGDLDDETPTPQADSQPIDPDSEAFRTAARLGLTLRFYGGCYAQSSMPGAQSAYEVVTGMEDAARDVLAERARQISAEGWSSEHDDEHQLDGDLAQAAACYAHQAFGDYGLPTYWPWAAKWWKPSKDPRRNLIKAGALILAEIERIDRAALKQGANHD